MRVVYQKPKGDRIKKGTVKFNGRRINNFHSISIKPKDCDGEWLYWSDELNMWGTYDELKEKGAEHCSSDNIKINNLKKAIRHIKKYNIPKGYMVTLNSNFTGYNIFIII